MKNSLFKDEKKSNYPIPVEKDFFKIVKVMAIDNDDEWLKAEKLIGSILTDIHVYHEPIQCTHTKHEDKSDWVKVSTPTQSVSRDWLPDQQTAQALGQTQGHSRNSGRTFAAPLLITSASKSIKILLVQYFSVSQFFCYFIHAVEQFISCNCNRFVIVYACLLDLLQFSRLAQYTSL